jgi:hypothetical protein
MRVARQSRFHRILEQGTSRRRGSRVQGTAEPALPGRQCRPLEGVTPQAARGWAYFTAEVGLSSCGQRTSLALSGVPIGRPAWPFCTASMSCGFGYWSSSR